MADNFLRYLTDYFKNKLRSSGKDIKCDGCNKYGSFQTNFPRALYGQEFDDNIYCNDCIPEAWERILEG